MVTTFNPSDSGSNITFTDGNLEVSGGGSTRSWRIVRSTTSRNSSSGFTKVYFEAFITTNNGGYCMAGIANASASLSNFLGSDANSIGYQINPTTNAELYQNGSGGAFGAANTSDTIGIALDLLNNLFWLYSPTTTYWNNSSSANPATGIGGISISGLAGSVFAAAAFYSDSSDTGIAITANFGGLTFAHTVPSGFYAWDAVSNVFNSADKSANITLTNGALTAQNTAGSAAYNGVRSGSSKTSGKIYCECTVNTISSYTAIGFANSTYTFTTNPGSDNNALVVFNGNGNAIKLNGSTLNSGSHSDTNGANVRIAIDFGAKLIWVTSTAQIAAGYAWNNSTTANPSTGTGGVSFSSMASGPYFFLFDSYEPNDEVTWNPGSSSFSGTIPTAFVSWDGSQSGFTVTTLDPTESGSNITLSNGNLTATCAGSTLGWRTVRSTTTRSASSPNTKLYFEIVTVGPPGGYVIGGVGTASASLTGPNWGANSSSFGLQVLSGTTPAYYANSGSGTPLGTATATTGQYIGYAIDLVAQLIWIYTPGTGQWNGQALSASNPATGVGGISLSYIGSVALFVGISLYGDSTDASNGTVNFGDSAFSNSVPSGFVGWDNVASPATTWNPSDLGPGWVLSNGNLTAVKATGVQAVSCVRATNSQSTGKWYFEITAAGTNPINVVIGISNSSFSTSLFLGCTIDGMGLMSGGNAIFQDSNGYDVGGTPTFNTGDVVGVAIDCGAMVIWFQVNGGSWYPGSSANPATGVGGYIYGNFTYNGSESQRQMPSKEIYPTMFCISPGGGATANFGSSSFAHAAPSGFSAFNSQGTHASPIAETTNEVHVSKMLAYVVLTTGAPPQDPQILMIM